MLMRHPYPGNVRELENVLEHAYVVARGPLIGVEDLPAHVVNGTGLLNGHRPPAAAPAPPPLGLPAAVHPEADQRERLVECLERNYWSIPRAARELGVHRTTLRKKLDQYGVEEE